MWSAIGKWARAVKRDTLALYLAMRDPRTPWPAKLIGAVVVAYALSPIDLIPDFIPVLGQLDDLILLPFGIWITVKLVPPVVMNDCRARADAMEGRPVSWVAAVAIGAVWIGAAALVGWLIYSAIIESA
jgi:uncharacterized membrane protein YkvA (DUF1232 family)